jgi:GT2 family glycosyltransferase
MKASIILSSYNNLPALKLSIETLKIQAEKDFEIIIADDGSTDGTVEYLQEENIKHFTRPNEGYRLAYIWNRGAELASGDRYIFGNSDVIWGPGFVAEHLNYGDKLIAGLCLSIAIDDVPKVTAKKIHNDFNFISSLGVVDRRQDFIDKLKHPYLVHGKRIPPRYMYGGNWSCPARVFKKIQGLDEGFKGWGGEDFDFARRAKNAGNEIIINVDCKGYHLDHEKVNRDKSRAIGKGYFNEKWNK